MKRLFTSHRLLTALFATLFFTLTSTISISNAQTHIHVDAVNGSNEPTGRGAAGKAYKSITYAFLISEKSSLPDPWHVHIHPGTYSADPAKPANEREVFPIKLRSNMVFQGTTTAAECILDAQHLGETQTEILLGLDVGDVSVRNLTIQNMNRQGYNEDAGAGGITFWDTGGGRETANSLESCVVHNINPIGVKTNLSLVLIGNTFSNNRHFGVWTNTSVTVLNNTFSANGYRSSNGTALRIAGASTGNISNNVFQNNESDRMAGGIHIETLNANMTHNTFTGNKGGDAGLAGSGGIHVQTLTGDVTHNTFTDNEGKGFGAGGIRVDTLTGDVTHNTFTGNVGSSGALFVQKFNGNLTHNTFTRNTGIRGGGFTVERDFTGSITHNIFDSNVGENGGACRLEAANAKVANNIFLNNTSTQNKGESVYIHLGSAHFTNNLFMISDALSAGTSAVLVSSVPGAYASFHNNIFSGMNTAIYNGTSHDLPITHNLFHNIGTDFVNQAGSGTGNDLDFWELLADGASNNIVGGLLLKDPGNGDFHPVAGSPTIDAGTNEHAPADDFDGVARPIGGTVDIGPYEYKGVSTDQPATFLPEDVNEDGRVSIADIVTVAQSLRKPVSEKPRADINGDGKISLADLVSVARYIAEARSDPVALQLAAAPGHQEVRLDAATVQTWLRLARIEDDGSLMFREGIANLERLLASLVPKETVLLANYPNPFNPETWIPYRLATPVDVSVEIHTTDGRLVRRLALGELPAGVYADKSRAAYWDGRNAQGEPVASGVYFYTLTAGDFSATRKMLIRK